jgi:hypothetical protein
VRPRGQQGFAAPLPHHAILQVRPRPAHAVTLMTESQWEASDDPFQLLSWVSPSLSMRKARLYAVAACRRAWELLEDPRSRRAVEAAEAWADRALGWREVGLRRREATAYLKGLGGREDYDPRRRGLALAATLVAGRTRQEVGQAAWQAFYALAQDGRPMLRDRPLADLVRDIAGNPFRPIQIDASWLAWDEGTLVRLARSIYEERRWHDLPVLGDALEDAGCTDEELLPHCRGEGPHARGCFVVDALLGKT